MYVYLYRVNMTDLKPTKMKALKNEVWMVNGRRFSTYEKAIKYCTESNFRITEEVTFMYFKTKVHTLNVLVEK